MLGIGLAQQHPISPDLPPLGEVLRVDHHLPIRATTLRRWLRLDKRSTAEIFAALFDDREAVSLREVRAWFVLPEVQATVSDLWYPPIEHKAHLPTAVDELPAVLPLSRAADVLGVSVERLLTLLKRGDGPPHEITGSGVGRRYAFDRDVLLAWAAEQSEAA